MRRAAAIALAALVSGAAAAEVPNVVPSATLTQWLRAQGDVDAAQWRVFDLMHAADQFDGLRPERLDSDLKRMTQDEVSEVTERVMRSDIDDDGAVTLDEFITMEPARTPEDLQREFARYDPDGDRRADRAAVNLGARTAGEAESAANPLREMAAWDLDGDRVATRDEIRRVLDANAPAIWPAR
ncbi:hypothetical protein [Jannaschia pohangensis]|uniref:EF hand n=1 Tax=Jannaschia pohangensis TaxID=390807 RepID=A0A1I3IG97_9RHOB|nr:hypothetical protein [Jannaschia pohangensis]SFI46823.1 hypothetical protein SAMN04488095_0951 [Jannaschia pohangensis]